MLKGGSNGKKTSHAFSSGYISWSRTWSFSKRHNDQYVSVPGTITRVDVTFQESTNFTNSRNLKFMWIPDKYKKYLYFAVMQATECQSMNRVLNYSYCLNHSFLLDKTKSHRYFVFVRRSHTFHHQLNTTRESPHVVQVSQLKSWAEALHLCEEAGGYLPQFRNREELEEFIAFVKLSSDTPPC